MGIRQTDFIDALDNINLIFKYQIFSQPRRVS